MTKKSSNLLIFSQFFFLLIVIFLFLLTTSCDIYYSRSPNFCVVNHEIKHWSSFYAFIQFHFDIPYWSYPVGISLIVGSRIGHQIFKWPHAHAYTNTYIYIHIHTKFILDTVDQYLLIEVFGSKASLELESCSCSSMVPGLLQGCAQCVLQPLSQEEIELQRRSQKIDRWAFFKGLLTIF